MCKKIKDKLKSQKGTSIFFGLLLFLVASILSAVMIDAAVTTMKRVASDKKAEQNYLICASAAKLLQDAIIDTKVVRTVTETKNGTGDITRSDPVWTVEGNGTGGTSGSAFGDLLKDYIKEYIGNSLVAFPEKELNISLPSNVTDQVKDIDKVTVKLMIDSGTGETSGTADPGCYITVKLSVGSGTDICRMVLSLNGSAATASQTSGNRTDIKTTYTWTKNDIFYGEEKRTLKEP